jgi:nicotinate phosphoribosyltransferase
LPIPAFKGYGEPGGLFVKETGYNSALLTDFYSLTMAQGYWKKKMDGKAVFEMFFRRQPFGGGFSVFAGLGTLLERLRGFSFSPEDLEYLGGLGVFEGAFLGYLEEFRFSGSLWAMDEGTVIFPQEPIIRITGGLIECQIIEGMLLNIINFQSLIATRPPGYGSPRGRGPSWNSASAAPRGRTGPCPPPGQAI